MAKKTTRWESCLKQVRNSPEGVTHLSFSLGYYPHYLFSCPNYSFCSLYSYCSGFGGLGVACWPLEPKFAGSNPAEAVGFLRGEKNPQHAFLRRGSKAVGPMS